MTAGDRSGGLAGWRTWTLGVASLLWVACWSAINAGPWHLHWNLAAPTDWINALRALAPLALLPLWLVLLPLRQSGIRPVTAAEGWWVGYALLSVFAALRMPDSFSGLYWGLAYLSVFVAVEWSLARDDSPARAMAMNRLNWLLGTLLLLVMLGFARDSLLVRGELGLTAYGLVNRVDLGAFGPVSRSTGMARLAIVPALVGLVFALAGRGIGRLLWAALSLAAFLLIWFVQARQGVIGAVIAVGLVGWLFGGRVRLLGILLFLLGALLLAAGLLPQERLDHLWQFAMRGAGLGAFEGMTGRDLIWRVGWAAVEQSPWLGYGPQADRAVLGMNAQNGLLYAALAAGYPGVVLYGAGLAWGWVLYLRAWRRGYAQTREEWLFMLQAGGIMAYLTIRNIPENTAALFSVDLLLHAPILAWLGTLERVRGPQWRRARAAARMAPVAAVQPAAAAPPVIHPQSSAASAVGPQCHRS